MNEPGLSPRQTGGGRIESTVSGSRLWIPPGDQKSYRLAQLDDCNERRRSEFRWRPPVYVGLRARVNATDLPGTWGFGFWNDPLGVGCGPNMEGTRLPAFPMALWFFYASARSHLSLNNSNPPHGFYAQVFKSPEPGPWLLPVGFALALKPRRGRHELARHVTEETARVEVDPSAWHRYEIEWEERSARFRIDGRSLLQTTAAPPAPLGMVIWIDNQYASFGPSGRLSWGLESGIQEAWLEIDDLVCQSQPSA